MTSCPGNDETNLRYWAGSKNPLKRLRGCSIGSSNASKLDKEIVNLFFVKTWGEQLKNCALENYFQLFYKGFITNLDDKINILYFRE